MRRQVSAEQIACGRSNWDRQIEHPENSSANILMEKVGDKRGRNRNKRRFTDTNQRVPDQKFGVVVCYGGAAE